MKFSFFFLLLSLFIFSCGSHAVSPTSSPVSPSADADRYCSDLGRHSVFAIHVNGADIGREVRTDIVEEGPDGRPRRSILSHSVKNEKMGSVLFQKVFIRQEVTDSLSGNLVYASFTKKDQVATHVVQISAEAESYERTVFSTSSFTSHSKEKKDTVPVLGNEIIGFRLTDRLKDCLNDKNLCTPISFFDAQLNSPVRLAIFPPVPSSLTIEGRSVDGFWIEIRHINRNTLLSRYFFDARGTLLLEEYPELHESRILLSGPFYFSNDTSELLVGLRSDTYIYDPNIASSAVYKLTASPDRLNGLDMLLEPENHTVKRISENEMILRVTAGAPDKNDLPTDADLSSSIYIRPEDPKIINALSYLKSAGKSGRLAEKRRLNATSIIAQASLLPRPAKTWSDPNQSAALIMQYTNALLPDKSHTFSMADAVTTLSKGGGDCTEHAVLFASLMRAHKIPTRLVSGMLLTPGGLWAYHMWNSYWDGESWHSIDPSTLTFRPGALYVALGSGSSFFKQVRDRLADFMWRTFSGVSFNLIEASNNGEKLFLARPVEHNKNLSETALFNAVVLSGRGDHQGALSLLDDHIPENARTLSVKMMRIELLFNAGDFNKALENIRLVRNETSSAENTFFLDLFEFKCLLNSKEIEKAETLLSRLTEQLSDDVEKAVLRAEYLFFCKKEDESLSLLKDIIIEHPNNLDALSKFAQFVSMQRKPSSENLSNAVKIAVRSVSLSYFSEPSYIKTLSRLLAEAEHFDVASWYLDHALILAPKDKELRSFQKELPPVGACLDKN